MQKYLFPALCAILLYSGHTRRRPALTAAGAAGLAIWIVFNIKKSEGTAGTGKVAEKKAKDMHGQAFVDKTHKIEARLGMPKNTLISIMFAESGFRHQVQNSIGAVGLIQFHPRYHDTEYIKSLDALTQLDEVEKYYLRKLQRGGAPETAEEWYLSTFFPAAVGKGENYLIGGESGAATIAAQNSGFDMNKDGRIYTKEFYLYIKTAPRLQGTVFQEDPVT